MISPEAKTLLDSAASRPWAWNGESVVEEFYGRSWEITQGERGEITVFGCSDADAALIVAAVNDYERLLTVEAERDALKEALRREKDLHDAATDAIVRSPHVLPEPHDFDIDVRRPDCALCESLSGAQWLVETLRKSEKNSDEEMDEWFDPTKPYWPGEAAE